MNYDAQHFINKFEALPEECWCMHLYSKEKDGARLHCALGHCGAVIGEPFPEEAEALKDIFRPLSVIDVNDKRCSDFQQDTPKERILAALKTKST